LLSLRAVCITVGPKAQYYARFYWASGGAFEVAQIGMELQVIELKVYERQWHAACWM